MNLEVLWEDNHCLAVNKPAGMLAQGDATGAPSLVDWAKAYIKAKYHKPGNVYIGLLHRLDRPTSGVVLLARTGKAAGRLSAQFRDGAISKLYWAIVEGRPQEQEGEWADTLQKDRATNTVAVAATGSASGKEARLSFRVLDSWGPYTKLELRPATGRSHQLRVQLASRGLPIVGDRKYGARTALEAADGGFRIALHARRLVFTHPTRGEVFAVDAPMQADWPEPLPARLESGCSSSTRGEGTSR
jgi:23S rRNA pseudouridine1911/1915/1917 synthase